MNGRVFTDFEKVVYARKGNVYGAKFEIEVGEVYIVFPSDYVPNGMTAIVPYTPHFITAPYWVLTSSLCTTSEWEKIQKEKCDMKKNSVTDLAHLLAEAMKRENTSEIEVVLSDVFAMRAKLERVRR